MKVLILSCSTGEGHNSAALALKEEFQKRKINVVMKDALSFGNQKSSHIVKTFFNNVAIKTPSIFGIMYKAGKIISNPIIKSPVYLANLTYAQNMLKYIKNNKIDCIICTHLFPMEALTYLKRKNKLQAKTYAVLTDYTAIPFIEETELDYYFIPSEKLIKEFTNKKIPITKLIPLGIPVNSKFNIKKSKDESRTQLNLPLDKKIILIMTGGIGCGNIILMLNELLLKIDNNTIILVLVGKNKKLKNDISNYFDKKKIIPIPFTKEVSLYMDACDVLLSKPGGLSSTEAAVKNVALIHTLPIPGCETENAIFFSNQNMSIKVSDIDTLASQTIKLLNSKEKIKSIKENQRKNINAFATSNIVDYILKN